MFDVYQWIKDCLAVFVFVLLSQMPKVLEDRIIMSFLFSCFCLIDTLFFCYGFRKWTRATYKDLCGAITMWSLTMLYIFTSIVLPLSELCWVIMFINLGYVYSVVNTMNMYNQFSYNTVL